MMQDDLIQVDVMYNDGKHYDERYNDAMIRVGTMLLLGKFIFIPFFNIHADVIFYAQ